MVRHHSRSTINYPRFSWGVSHGPIEPLERRRLLADVVGLTLIDAQNDHAIGEFELVNGAIIDLAAHGRQLSIRADVAPDQSAGSVRFNYDGESDYHIESTAPFAIAGNDANDFYPWTPALGTHTLIVTGYGGAKASGERDGSRLLTFQVIDSSAAPPGGTTLRVNAGGGAYTTAGGALFGKESGFTGGVTPQSSFSVSGTDNDPLYFTRRFGRRMHFAAPVENGLYTLTLHFAEPTFKKPGQRVFDVSAEGKVVLDDYDLFVRAGTKRAISESFEVAVSDGVLSLSFAASVNNAIISAIELVPREGAPLIATPAPVRIDAGGEGLIGDSIGRIFEGDSGFAGGAIGQTSFDVLNTSDDAIFTTYRAGHAFSFSRAVANGNYAVWLELADPTSTAAGQRVFDVSAEGDLALDGFDPFAAAGAAQTAAAVRFDVSVTDGAIDLSFEGVVGEAMVSAIVLLPTDIPPFMLWHAGVGDYTDPVRHEAVLTSWKVRSASNLRQIGQGILLYSNEHRGDYPPSLAAMMAELDLFGLDVFANPRIPTAVPRGQTSLLEKVAWVKEQDDYIYVGAGLRNNAPATVIVAYENPDTTPGDVLNALYADGHVGEVSRGALVAQFGGSEVSPPPLPRPVNLSGDAKVVQSASNLRQLSQKLLFYSNDFKGRYPPDLGTLYLTQDVDPMIFVNPRGLTPPPPPGMTREQTAAWINASTDYVYLAANKSVSSRDPIVAYENPAEMAGGINILFNDGRVEFVEMRWAVELIAAAGGPGAG